MAQTVVHFGLPGNVIIRVELDHKLTHAGAIIAASGQLKGRGITLPCGTSRRVFYKEA